MLDWFAANTEWVFSGIGVAVFSAIVVALYRNTKIPRPARANGLARHIFSKTEKSSDLDVSIKNSTIRSGRDIVVIRGDQHNF